MGVSLNKLSSEVNHQISLFEDVAVTKNNNELDKIIDKLKETYGNNIVIRASSIKKDK